MGKKLELTGQTFGLLKVLRKADEEECKKKRCTLWVCECSCPNHTIKIVRGGDLTSGQVRSCGCLHTNMLIERNKQGHKTNTYSDLQEDEHGKYYVGYASNTNNEFYIDADDFEKIKNYCWREVVDNKGYHYIGTQVLEGNKKTTLKIQYLILGKNVDHADRNPLNNRKYNLRFATSKEQNQNQRKHSNNTSGFTGVYYNKKTGKWKAAIGVNCRFIHLGTFENKEDAIVARLQGEMDFFGEDFAPQRDLFAQYHIKKQGEEENE